ncbi:hypothetical protein HK101_003875, partial [Irineochytrium annulatum]
MAAAIGPRWRRAIPPPLTSLLLLHLLGLLIVFLLNPFRLPAVPPRSSDSPNVHDAADLVQNLTSLGPRPFSSLANLQSANLILSNLKEIARSHPGRIDVEQDMAASGTAKSIWRPLLHKNGPRATVVGTVQHRLRVGNILATIPGACEMERRRSNGTSDVGLCRTILVNTHYDTVTTGPGATDATMSVASMLILARRLVTAAQPMRDTLLLLFNNGEECFYWGGRSFADKGGLENVTAFLNLEGAGSGGGVMVFRASDRALLDGYAASAGRPHASVVGNDVMRLGLVASNTDYTVFNERVPGLDMSFYVDRHKYHTAQDIFDPALHLPSLHHLLDSLTTTVLTLCNTSSTKPIGAPSTRPAVYFDVLGLRMVVIPFETLSLLALASIVALPSLHLLRHSLVTASSVDAPSWWSLTGAAACALAGVMTVPAMATAAVDKLRPQGCVEGEVAWGILIVAGGWIG